MSPLTPDKADWAVAAAKWVSGFSPAQGSHQKGVKSTSISGNEVVALHCHDGIATKSCFHATRESMEASRPGKSSPLHAAQTRKQAFMDEVALLTGRQAFGHICQYSLSCNVKDEKRCLANLVPHD